MEHADAIATTAAERYLMNELSDVDRDAFEEHFFECAACATDIREGSRLMIAGRMVARQEQGAETPRGNVVQMPDRRRWTAWLPQAAAATLLIGILAYQNAVTIPSLRRGSIAIPTQHQFSPSDTRAAGETQPVTTLRAGEPSVLWVEVPPREVASYSLEVRDSAGKTLASRAVSRDDSIEPIPLLIDSLPTGNYSVVIEGVDEQSTRSEITQHAFRVVGGK